MKPYLAVLLVLLALGCSPRQAPPEPPPPPPPGLAPVPPPGPPPPRGDGPRRDRPQPERPAAPARPFDESLLRGKEPLLEVPFADAQPRDIRLGTLASGPEADAVKKFLETASRGGEAPLDPRTLEPRWTAYLQGWARRAAREGLTGEVRAGVPQPENGGGAMVPVRVIGDKKEWQGWVFLVPAEGRWLVADAQLESRDRDTAPFDPEGQLISSPSRR